MAVGYTAAGGAVSKRVRQLRTAGDHTGQDGLESTLEDETSIRRRGVGA